jgi:tetratricopeptide (TPR) repeat protein
MNRALRGLTALSLLLAGPLAAQGPIADRLVGDRGKPAPECLIPGRNHFQVSGAATYFKSGLEKSDPAQRRGFFRQTRDNAANAISQSGQAGNAAAWYYYGRASLDLGDIVAADSAFKKVDQLAPICVADIRTARREALIALITPAQTFQQANQHDSALVMLRAASRIDPNRPNAVYGMANSFAALNQNDSALVYFGKALDAQGDTSTSAKNIRQAAAFQLGVMAFNARDYQGSVRGFSVALALNPEDADARRNLVSALRSAGMPDSAAKIEQQMMAAAAGSEGGLSAAQLAEIGVVRYNANDFAGAIVAFEKIIEVEPYNRDALFNLAQSYKGAGNADKQLEVANRLRAVEPLSFGALQLIGQAYQTKKDQQNIIKTFEQLTSATVDVTAGFATTATGASLTLHAKGREGRDINDRLVRPAAIVVIVEFLDKAGAVVTTAEVTVPALAKDAAQDIVATGNGAGITAWRYKRK